MSHAKVGRVLDASKALGEGSSNPTESVEFREEVSSFMRIVAEW